MKRLGLLLLLLCPRLAAPARAGSTSYCNPAIETRIAGEFNGWDKRTDPMARSHVHSLQAGPGAGREASGHRSPSMIPIPVTKAKTGAQPDL